MTNTTDHNAKSTRALNVFLCNKTAPSRGTGDKETKDIQYKIESTKMDGAVSEMLLSDKEMFRRDRNVQCSQKYPIAFHLFYIVYVV